MHGVIVPVDRPLFGGEIQILVAQHVKAPSRDPIRPLRGIVRGPRKRPPQAIRELRPVAPPPAPVAPAKPAAPAEGEGDKPAE